MVQLHRWGLLDAVLASGAPAIRQVTFSAAGASVTRSVKHKSGVDLLVAPCRFVLDTIVTGVRFDDTGRACGVHGHDAAGAPVDIAARYVVGADGYHRDAVTGHGLSDVALAAAARCFFATAIDAAGAEPDAGYRTSLEPELRQALTVGRAIAAGVCASGPALATSTHDIDRRDASGARRSAVPAIRCLLLVVTQVAVPGGRAALTCTQGFTTLPTQ